MESESPTIEQRGPTLIDGKLFTRGFRRRPRRLTTDSVPADDLMPVREPEWVIDVVSETVNGVEVVRSFKARTGSACADKV